MKVKEESEKVGLKLNIQKTKIMASDPITSWQIDGETVEAVSGFILGGSKITAMVTAAMKLKDAYSLGFPGGSKVKASNCNAEDMGSIRGSGRSPGEGNGNPLQYSCLENPINRAWWATVHGVTKSQSGLGPWVAKEWDTAEQLTQCLRGCLRNSHYILGQPQPVDCSHEIKRRLLLGRKARTNLNSVLKSRDIPLPT